MLDKQHVKKVVLKVLKFYTEAEVSPYMMNNTYLSVDRQISEIGERLIINMRTSILGQENIQKYNVDFESPLNWWEHFKQDRLPSWLKLRWPVKYSKETKTIKINHMALAPNLDIYLKDGINEVVMHSQIVQ